jgi:hypothetical protein
MRIKIPGLAKISVKEITKLESTSLSDFKLHTKESQEKRFFPRIVCAAAGGMTGSVKNITPTEAEKEFIEAWKRRGTANRKSQAPCRRTWPG